MPNPTQPLARAKRRLSVGSTQDAAPDFLPPHLLRFDKSSVACTCNPARSAARLSADGAPVMC